MNTKRADMQPGAVLTYELNPADKSKIVQSIAIVGMPGPSPIIPTLYWSLWLAVSDKHSVSLTMQSGNGAGGRTGQLACRSEKQRVTRFSATTHIINPSRSFTVDELISTLARYECLNYRFNFLLQGDHFWCMEVIRLLDGIDLVQQGSVLRLDEHVAQQNKYNQTPSYPTRGEFIGNVPWDVSRYP